MVSNAGSRAGALTVLGNVFASTAHSKPSHLTNKSFAIAPTSLHNGSQRTQQCLQVGNSHCRRLIPRIGIHLRCQGWYSCCHLRPAAGSLKPGGERGNTLPGAMATEGHHVRRPDEASQH